MSFCNIPMVSLTAIIHKKEIHWLTIRHHTGGHLCELCESHQKASNSDPQLWGLLMGSFQVPHEFRVHGHFAEAVSIIGCHLVPISPLGWVVGSMCSGLPITWDKLRTQ